MFDLYGGQTYVPMSQQRGSYVSDPYSSVSRSQDSYGAGMGSNPTFWNAGGMPFTPPQNQNPFGQSSSSQSGAFDSSPFFWQSSAPGSVGQKFLSLTNNGQTPQTSLPGGYSSGGGGNNFSNPLLPYFQRNFNPNENSWTQFMNTFTGASNAVNDYGTQHGYDWRPNVTGPPTQSANDAFSMLNQNYGNVYNSYAQSGAFGLNSPTTTPGMR